MEGKEAKSIQVYIAGRSYPLKVNEEDASAIMKIAEEVNDKIQYFQRTYSNRDKQDCLSMALLTYAVDLYKARLNNAEGQLSDRLGKLDELLTSLLH
ncbi:MAG TPA: cell division protein ZapA [Saprospiraceae bacterium]|nr:cell division protein ZapA [Saprospiraceae bacterium]MCB9269902.1 cell division protein ZapA [Lewinellaceae bacterium]MCB9321842.1 cell division protein ZapA [Lewinellaceae bacterium]HPG07194.1 cell division protein ZapA [Saprospiraceae bacterium]HPR01787.1 cell division protein ZapA [Saprospiraceae bacterium]